MCLYVYTRTCGFSITVPRLFSISRAHFSGQQLPRQLDWVCGAWPPCSATLTPSTLPARLLYFGVLGCKVYAIGDWNHDKLINNVEMVAVGIKNLLSQMVTTRSSIWHFVFKRKEDTLIICCGMQSVL
jgi:hypothetical protein